jgi:hypothetical protein
MMFKQMIPLEILATEIIYFILVFCVCIFIYYKTRDAYNLTKHQGIFHFRNIFLYFALAYAFRLLHISIILLLDPRMFQNIRALQPISLLLVGYFSTMAVLSVAMAALIKKIKNHKDGLHTLNNSLHIVAIILAVIVALTRSHHVLILVLSVVFIVSIIFSIPKKKTKGIISQNKITYLLLFIFWILNILTLTKGVIPQELKIPLYVISAAIFLWIFIRVRKRLFSNAKKKR